VPPIDSVLAFAVAAFVLIIVPGPSVLFVVSRGVALGRRAALLSVVGNEAGLAVHVVAVAVGLGAVVERSVTVFTVLKLAGAAYLVYLGVKAIRGRRSLRGVLDAAALPKRSRRLFAEGFLVGVGNPKVIIFLAAILPQFVDPHGATPGLQMLVLGLLFIVIALACDSVWAVAAGSARNALASSPKRLERMGAAGGVVMIGLGVRLAVAGRAD
jgi:threonine/homoserine/homoserine lactone efflux protein